MKRRFWHYLPLLILCILFSLLMVNLLITRQYDRTMQKSDTLVQELFDYIRESNARRMSKIEEANQTHCTRVQNSLSLAADVLQKAGLCSANLGDGEDPSLQLADSLLEEDDFSDTVLLVRTDGMILMQWTCEDSWISTLIDKNIKDALNLSEESWKILCAGNAETYSEAQTVSGSLSYGDYEETMTCMAQPVSGSDLILVFAENESISALRGVNYTSLDYVNNLDDDISFLCIRQSDGVVLNAIDFAYEYVATAEELGVTQAMMQEGFHGSLNIQGTEYILDTIVISVQNDAPVSVIALRSSSVLVRTDSIIWAAIIFFAVSMLFTLYALFVKFSHEARTSQKCFQLFGRLRIRRLVLKKLLPVALICILLVLAFGYVSGTVCNLDEAMSTVALRQKSILSDVENVYQLEQFSQDYTSKDLRRQARLLGGYLSFHADQIFDGDQYRSVIPYYYTDSDSQKNLPLTDINGNAVECVAGSKILSEARSILGFASISVYNLDGAAILTSESSQPERIENDDPLMKVLLRKETSLVVGNEDYHTQTIAVPYNLYTIDCENNESDYITEEEYYTYLEEGSYSVHCIPIMICATRSCELAELDTDSQSIAYELENSSSGHYSYMLFANDEDHTLLYLPETLQGETVKSMKLPETLLQGTHYAIQKIAGREYLLYSGKVTISDTDESYWLVTLIDSNTIQAQRLQNVLYTGFAALFFLVLILLLIPLEMKRKTEGLTKEEENESEIFRLNQKINWQQKTPEKKALFLCSLCMDALGIYVAINAFTLVQTGNINSVLGWLTSMNWDRGFNLFSLLSIGLLILWTHLAKQILSGLLMVLKSVSYGRAETCLRLMVSVCRYAMSLACVFFGLYLLGLNAMSVLTSLGVFSMLLGLGANKLFGDIIAGVFMVVEGEIQVGDIVTIGNFCGKVTEIGIRTTKIQNLDGNVTILTNSSIINVLNMTRHTSRVKIDLAVNKSVPMETVEKCLEDVLPVISAACKIPHENLEYLGVDQINGANNIYRIECSCAEYLRNSLFRHLNRALSTELKKNNIPLS